MAAITTERAERIRFILGRLRGTDVSQDARYARDENIRFFEAARDVFSYLGWLYGARKRIDPDRLLELYEVLPEFDTEFHERMAQVERQPRPGIIEPLVAALAEAVRAAPSGRVRIASLGCGSMEAERQLLSRLPPGLARRVTIAGFDISVDARAFARENLSKAGALVKTEEHLSVSALGTLESEAGTRPLVIVGGNDIFTLAEEFGRDRFSVAMTALFLHHLPREKRTDLLALMRELAPMSINYDGYQNEVVVPIVSMTGWRHPVFLNAAVFSMIRFPSKGEARSLHEGAELDFYTHGHYRALRAREV